MSIKLFPVVKVFFNDGCQRNKLVRKLDQMVNKLKIETYISIEMTDEEADIH